MSFYRHSFFPFVIIILSLALAGLIYWSTQTQPPSSSVLIQEVEPVDPEVYQERLSDIVTTFIQRTSDSQDDLEKLLAVQTALAGLLDLRVPVQFKDLHLSLAVSLSQIQTALESDDRNIEEPLAAIAQLTQMYSWLAR